MNIKEWKQFSDAVDKYNWNGKKDCVFRDIEQQEEWDKKYEENQLIAHTVFADIKKTQENFWEWKIKKLKLK